MRDRIYKRNNRVRNRKIIDRNIRSVLIALLFAVLLLTGAAFRTLSGHDIVMTSLVYAPSEKIGYPGSRTPEDTVTSFYLSIDNGDYERAYDLILEPRWTEKPAAYGEAVGIEGALFHGFTDEQEFLRRMKYEIGPGGTGIKLNSVQAEVLQSLNAEPYAKSFDLGGIRSAYSVHARGSMLGACSIFSWKKQLTVLQVGRRYRIFLDGSKEENSFYYQSWFAGVEKIGDLRSGPLESGETGAGSSGSILTQPVQYGGSGGEKSDLNVPVGCPCGGGP